MARILAVLVYVLGLAWGWPMSNPIFTRSVVSGDKDSLGDTILAGTLYAREWLQRLYLTNAGFETGDFTGWTADAGMTVSNAAARTGTYSAKTPNDGRGHVLYSDKIAWEPGRTLSAVGYIRAVTPGTSCTASMSVRWYNSSSVEISGTEPGTTTTSSTADWVSVTYTSDPAPASAAYVDLVVSLGLSAGGAYADDFGVANSRSTAVLTDYVTIYSAFTETFTFPHCPQTSDTAADQPATLTELADGTLAGRWKREPRDTISLVFDGLDREYVDQLRRFYKKQRGSGISFTYTDYLGVAYTVRFASPLAVATDATGAYQNVGIKLLREAPGD